MITMQNTENLTGVTLSGDYYDLEALVDAFYAVTVDEDDVKNSRYIELSTRVLASCYDIRHASQGDRDILLRENGMNNELMTFHEQLFPRQNLYYSVNLLYPETLFLMKALEDLIKLYMESLVKSKDKYFASMAKEVLWDKHIPVLRLFQGAFASCVKEILTPTSYTRWYKLIHESYTEAYGICQQYVDLKNIEYLGMTREQRVKKLSPLAKHMADFDRDTEHNSIKRQILEEARALGCPPERLSLADYDYPEEIEW